LITQHNSPPHTLWGCLETLPPDVVTSSWNTSVTKTGMPGIRRAQNVVDLSLICDIT